MKKSEISAMKVYLLNVHMLTNTKKCVRIGLSVDEQRQELLWHIIARHRLKTRPFPPFFFNDTATTEIYTLSHTTLFRSAGMGGCLVLVQRASNFAAPDKPNNGCAAQAFSTSFTFAVRSSTSARDSQPTLSTSTQPKIGRSHV